ncbi:MAG: hypothetical protein CMJ64_10420, partial [Planctomycetaceae bacterium]|nr:hypothetical protein [Planctomycetaceae bacterium]
SESRQDFRNCGWPKLLASFATTVIDRMILSGIASDVDSPNQALQSKTGSALGPLSSRGA